MNASNPIPTDYGVFREAIRTFLKGALTPELIRAGQRTTSVFSDFEAGKNMAKYSPCQGLGSA